MKNRKLVGAILGTIVLTSIFYFLNKKVNNDEEPKVEIKAYQQHVEVMKEGADPSIGTTELPEDFIVDGNFESHLPLVVIDVKQQEIKRSKEFIEKEDGSGQIVVYTQDDPYTMGQISIIDNNNYDNKISDKPAIVSDMKIKLRGSSSQKFDKKQYAIKMLDENGNSKKVDVMGMGENKDWILNISMLDGSLMRNYTAYMYGSALFPGTPDCKFCEVVMKNGEDKYEYIGVYLMMEKIEKGSDRVNLKDYEPGDQLVSYLLRRDRENENENQLSTYGSENNLTYGRLSILYPEDDILDEYAKDYITKDIDTIDRVLYSDDLNKFNTWPEYLDEQSFVDYFVFNSIFRNYDAGNNSTFMYKNAGGKLCMGPVWDYDNACNNDYNAIQVPDYDYFSNHPWFERLVLSKDYVKLLESRYKELTSGIFSADNIEQYCDDVEKFLGNAALRDWKRWDNHYGLNSTYSKSYGIKDSQGFVVDRRTETFQDEVDRYQNYFHLEEQYMMNNLQDLEKDVFKNDVYNGSYFAIVFFISIVCMIVLISRRKMFK